jgi:hypothetical protein
LFEEDFINKKIVIHSSKGIICAYIISELNFKKYNYWEFPRHLPSGDWLPYEKEINLSGKGTVSIIIKLIEYCEMCEIIKIIKYCEMKKNSLISKETTIMDFFF